MSLTSGRRFRDRPTKLVTAILGGLAVFLLSGSVLAYRPNAELPEISGTERIAFKGGTYFLKVSGDGPSGLNSTIRKMACTVERISPAFTTADAVITSSLSFSEVLGVTDRTGYFEPYANLTNWAYMNEKNDWSQTLSATPITAPRVGVYVDGQLWWGEEPK